MLGKTLPNEGFGEKSFAAGEYRNLGLYPHATTVSVRKGDAIINGEPCKRLRLRKQEVLQISTSTGATLRITRQSPQKRGERRKK